jgi:hypothetical protein
MKRQSRHVMHGSDSSKKALGMLGVNFCFVRYSEIEDLRLKSSAASIALSQVAKSCADIKLMSTRSDEPETMAAAEELLQKSMDIWDTKLNTQSHNKASAAEESERDLAQTLKSIASPLTVSPNGRRKKSRRR